MNIHNRYGVRFASVIAVVTCMASSIAVAKIPPMSEEQLTAMASLVATGTILTSKTIGEVKHDHCYGWQAMQSTFQLEAIHKRPAPAKIAPKKNGHEMAEPPTKSTEVVVLTYRTRVVDEKSCDGGAESYRFTTGDRFKVWLSSTGTIDGHKAYGFINWNGLKRAPKRDKPAQE
jgi:hypothetical protein